MATVLGEANGYSESSDERGVACAEGVGAADGRCVSVIGRASRAMLPSGPRIENLIA